MCLFVVTTAQAVVIYGHRGARGLMPENTLPAYEAALKYGVNYVDIDIAITKDGVLVAQHDLTLNQDITRDEAGHWIDQKPYIIKDMTLAELKTFDVGQIKPNTAYSALFPLQKSIEHTAIPTLQEVIDYVKHQAGEKVGFQIEIKTDPLNPKISVSPDIIVNALDKILKEEDIVSRTKVQAFDWRCLILLQKLNPQVSTAYLTDLGGEVNMRNPDKKVAGLWTAGYLLKNYASLPQMIKSLGGTWWDAQDLELSKERIDDAHRIGLKVAAWSFPEQTRKDIDSDLTKKLIEMHVDGVITDRPDLLVRFQH